MIYGFDTDDQHAATAALLVYAIYRSRDRARFKTSLDMWERIERFVKDAAKRSKSLPEYVEALKPRLSCGSLRPESMRVGLAGEIPLEVYRDSETGAVSHFIQRAADPNAREFLTKVFEQADARQVIARAYRETSWIVLLVRDRLEREKPVEAALDAPLSTFSLEHHADA